MTAPDAEAGRLRQVALAVARTLARQAARQDHAKSLVEAEDVNELGTESRSKDDYDRAR